MNKRHLEKSTEMNISVYLLISHSRFRVFMTFNTATLLSVNFKPIHQLLTVQVRYNKLKTEIPGAIFIAETGKERRNLISSFIFPLEILFITGSFMQEI